MQIYEHYPINQSYHLPTVYTACIGARRERAEVSLKERKLALCLFLSNYYSPSLPLKCYFVLCFPSCYCAT